MTGTALVKAYNQPTNQLREYRAYLDIFVGPVRNSEFGDGQLCVPLYTIVQFKNSQSVFVLRPYVYYSFMGKHYVDAQSNWIDALSNWFGAQSILSRVISLC